MNYKKLSEIADIVMGQSPKGSSLNADGIGEPFMQGRKTFGRLYPTIDTWTTEPTKHGKSRAILFSVRAPVGDMNIAPCDLCIGRGLCAISGKNDFDTEYLYYLLSANIQKIKDKVTGTIFESINRNDLLETTLLVHDKDDRNKIVNILSPIDAKIECNNRTNDNLHEMCLLLYRELIDKTGGKKDLLKNHAKCILGGTPSRAKPEYWNGNINWINSGEINRFRILKPRETITELGLKKTSTTPLPVGTTVLAITGATLGQVSRLEVESCANQSVIGAIPDRSLTNEYVYLDILENINDIIGRQTGGAQQHINKNDVETYEIMIPDAEELSIFETKVESLFGQIRNNCIENERLTKLRDTLLPELLNGKIDISNIDI